MENRNLDGQIAVNPVKGFAGKAASPLPHSGRFTLSSFEFPVSISEEKDHGIYHS